MAKKQLALLVAFRQNAVSNQTVAELETVGCNYKTMLKKLIIHNYRCYENHEIDFLDLSFVVAKNNAGKSTLVEALRLVSIATSRFDTVRYLDAPSWTELPKKAKGISPSLKFFGFNSENIFHKYGDAPSIITAVFVDNIKVKIYIGDGAELFCTLQDASGDYLTSKGQAVAARIKQIHILPQITPIQKDEKILGKDYVRQHISSDLASLHFRNQLSLLYENFPQFTELAQQSWPGMRIRTLEGRNGMPGDKLSLLIQDSDYVAEIGWMGHGLQMWLQIMWFLARINRDEVVILDEPDVYMHPDLQRKLIKLLTKQFKQVIVSTHSIEIISEVDPANILIIDKAKIKSIYASNVPVVQRILNSIGSIHNLQLTKLWASKKLIIVEGEDITILKRLQYRIFPNSDEPFDTIPNFDIGGWGGWNYAKGSSLLLRETVDHNIKIYCLFDSDYHTEKQKNERLNDAKKLNVQIHIWKKKEIENYLIVPTTILRIIKEESKRAITITVSDIEEKISQIVKSNEEEILHNFATELQCEDRKLSIPTVMKEAKKYIDKLENRISGKTLISEINKWTHENFKVTLNPIKLANRIESNEIDNEIKNVITSIEKYSDL